MKRWFVLAGLWLAACGSPPTPLTSAAPREAPALYFPLTGHTVREPFLSYYEARDGLANFGYPITEAIVQDGWTVQYFQFARLEVHPENEPAYLVTVGWLGDLLHRRAPPVPGQSVPAAPEPDRRYFPETGHTASGLFLAYFEAHGDTVRFGRPISEPFLHGGLIVQDFQSARLIWRPDLPPEGQVELAPIGETYFLASDLPLTLLQPVAPPAGATRVDPGGGPGEAVRFARLRLEATPRPGVWRAVARLSAGDRPLAGAPAVLVLTGSGPGRERVFNLPPTRPSGESHVLFELPAGQPGGPFKLSLFDGARARLLAEIELENSGQRGIMYP